MYSYLRDITLVLGDDTHNSLPPAAIGKVSTTEQADDAAPARFVDGSEVSRQGNVAHPTISGSKER